MSIITGILVVIRLSSLLWWWNQATEDERYEADVIYKAAVVGISSEEFELFSDTVEAESDRSDNFEGRVLIALTILNRVNSDSFPDTISGVIYESGQFEVVSNGAIYSIGHSNIADMAIIEAYNRIESGNAPNVMYFNNSGYAYGSPYTYEGGNYFVTVP